MTVYTPYIHYLRTWFYDNIYNDKNQREYILQRINDCIGYRDPFFQEQPLSIIVRCEKNSNLLNLYRTFENALINIVSEQYSIEEEIAKIISSNNLPDNKWDFKNDIFENPSRLYLGISQIDDMAMISL